MIISGKSLVVEAPVFNVPKLKGGSACRIRATKPGYPSLPKYGKYYNGLIAYTFRDEMVVYVMDSTGAPSKVTVPILKFLDGTIEIIVDDGTTGELNESQP